MTSTKEVLLACTFIATFCALILASTNVDTDELNVDREIATDFLKRTFFHPGKTKCEEQKREASEKYEERCEPSINKLTGSRYCPDIKTWTGFKNYEIGGGYGR